MSYIKRVLKFFVKYYILALPLLIMSIISNYANMGSIMKTLTDIHNLSDDLQPVFNIPKIVTVFASNAFSLYGGLTTLLLSFIVIPVTYGIVNKAVESGDIGIKNYISSLKDNFSRYIFYFLGLMLVFFLFTSASVIVIFVVALMIFLPSSVGITLVVIAMAGSAAAGIILFIYVSLWFSAMSVDGLYLEDAFKKSIKSVRSSFPTVLLVTLLFVLSDFILRLLIELVNFSPAIEPLLISLPSMLSRFLLITFYIMYYKDKSSHDIITG